MIADNREHAAQRAAQATGWVLLYGGLAYLVCGVVAVAIAALLAVALPPPTGMALWPSPNDPPRPESALLPSVGIWLSAAAASPALVVAGPLLLAARRRNALRWAVLPSLLLGIALITWVAQILIWVWPAPPRTDAIGALPLAFLTGCSVLLIFSAAQTLRSRPYLTH